MRFVIIGVDHVLRTLYVSLYMTVFALHNCLQVVLGRTGFLTPPFDTAQFSVNAQPSSTTNAGGRISLWTLILDREKGKRWQIGRYPFDLRSQRGLVVPSRGILFVEYEDTLGRP